MEKRKKITSVELMNFILKGKTFFILVILFIVLSLMSPYFLTVKNIMNIIRQNAASGVVAVGFTFVVASGNLDLSIGRMLGLIGVITAIVSKIDGMPMFVVVLLALVLGCFCGSINGFIGTKMHIPMFITTVAMQGVFQGVNYIISRSSTITQIPKGYAAIGQKSIFGVIPVPVIIFLGMVIIGALMLNKTIFGRHLLAVGGNAQAAEVSGINKNRVTMLVCIFMGVCAAIGALIMTGRAASAQADAGSGMEMDAIAAVIIGGTTLGGGTGKVFGSLVGVLIIGMISNGLNLMGVDTNWQLVAKGLMIVAAVFLDYETGKISSRISNIKSK